MIRHLLFRMVTSVKRLLRRKKYTLSRKSTKYPPPKIECFGADNKIDIGESRFEKSVVRFYGTHCTLIIGNNCAIKNSTFWFEGKNGCIEIKDHTTIEGAHIAVVASNKITLGKDCMLSSGIYISTTDSHSIVDSSGQRINPDRDIVIGDHVWIGKQVNILKGVIISEHSVIGACSLVTSDVPAHSVVGGVPAKILRRDIDWLRKRI